VIDCGEVKVFVDPASMPMLMACPSIFDSIDVWIQVYQLNAAKSCACGTC
jgi:hypothetical protein